MNAYRLTLAAAVVLGLTASRANAISGCSTSNLNGNYAMQFSGTSAPNIAGSVGGVAVPAGIAPVSTAAVSGGNSTVPATGVARLFLDGNGALWGNSSVSLDGMWLQGSISGQYTVNSDCTASFTLTDATGAMENFYGVVVGQGDTTLIIQTDAGTGVFGALKKARGFCQVSDLAGTFGIQYSGTTVSTGTPYSSVGVLVLDGQGDISATESRFSAGASSTVLSSGSIVINPDCSATLSLSSTGAAPSSMTLSGILSLDEKQLLFVQSDAGSTAGGSLTAQ
jgi:hypothetical protein